MSSLSSDERVISPLNELRKTNRFKESQRKTKRVASEVRRLSGGPHWKKLQILKLKITKIINNKVLVTIPGKGTVTVLLAGVAPSDLLKVQRWFIEYDEQQFIKWKLLEAIFQSYEDSHYEFPSPGDLPRHPTNTTMSILRRSQSYNLWRQFSNAWLAPNGSDLSSATYGVRPEASDSELLNQNFWCIAHNANPYASADRINCLSIETSGEKDVQRGSNLSLPDGTELDLASSF